MLTLTVLARTDAEPLRHATSDVQVYAIESIRARPTDDVSSCSRKSADDVDFRYNKQRNAELLGLADEYLDTVEATYERVLRPAVDNLLSVAELTVQAQMLSESHETKFHNVRDKWLRDDERLGNAPDGFFATLQRLRNERAAARYSDGVLSVTPKEMPSLISSVRAMIYRAARRVGVVAASVDSGHGAPEN